MKKNRLLLFILFVSLYTFSQNKLDVFFDFNSDFPNEESKIKVNQWMMEHNNLEITKIFGYCDTVDDSNYNRELAMRRANTMLTYFKKESFPIADSVIIKSFGKDFKFSKNQDENRKVEVFYEVIKEKKPVAKSNYDIDFIPSSDAVRAESQSLDAKFKKAKVGELIRINNISFYLNSEKVREESQPLLEQLYMIMVMYPTLIIQINGHICCNPNPNETSLSYRRALTILRFLQKRGIQVNRLAFKGYGSNNPIYELPEKNEQEKAANRRVEILIVAKR